MKIRLVFLLSEKINKKLNTYSAIIPKKYKALFTLDKTHIPHITITTVAFEESKLSEILMEIENISKSVKGFNFKSEGLFHDGSGSVSIHLQENNHFKTIYTQALNTLGKNYTVKKLDYAPHITLTKYANESDANKSIIKMDKPIPLFDIESIAVCEDGDYGTCTKVIKDFIL